MLQILIGLAWTNLGLIASRCLPNSVPKRFGRLLFWIGVPMQVFALTHRSNFGNAPWLPVILVFSVLLLGFVISLFCLSGLKNVFCLYQQWERPELEYENQGLVPTRHGYKSRSQSLTADDGQNKTTEWIDNQSVRGSFILAAMLGNTMFIGMAIVPPLVSPQYAGWIVIFGIVHYLLGSYGIGVALANYYGESRRSQSYGIRLIQLLRVPTLWAFVLGYLSQPIHFSPALDSVLQSVLGAGIPTVFMLLGLQLGNLWATDQFRIAFLPALIRTLILPGLVGLGLAAVGLVGEARFAIVLMTGMPTNSANLILAEEYKLDPQLSASCVVTSTLLLPLTIPFWEISFH
jgi:malate permease and related proteins